MVVPILGSHRCGSSMIARILNLCGVYLGSSEVMMEPDEHNPTGYWENLKVHYLSDVALGEFGIHWNQLKRLPDNAVRSKKGRRVIRAMRGLIEDCFADQSVWGWKEPRTCVLMPLWLKAIHDRDIRPVVIWRPVEDMARSLSRVQGMSAREAAKLIQHNMAVLLRNLPIGYHNVFYKKVLENPQAEVVKICDYLGLQNPPMDDILKFVDPKLNHGGKVTDRELRKFLGESTLGYMRATEAAYEKIFEIFARAAKAKEPEGEK